MTSAELEERPFAYRRRVWRMSALLTPGGVAVAVGVPPLLGFSVWHRPEHPTPAQIVCIGCLAGVFFGGMVFLAWFSRTAARTCGLVCPSCGALLGPGQMWGKQRRAFLATGKCGRCGAQVITDVTPG
jgi:hypothetical protein